MKYFKSSEFDSPDKPGTGLLMDDQFLFKLDDARGIAGVPFIINSAYRTTQHNSRVGGVDSSSHTSGHAVDIACRDSRSRWLIVDALVKCGFNRIGIADTFIHVDDDPTKEPDVMWVY